MRERPILFSAPMVRAILEGRKTQTRRVVKGEIRPDFGMYSFPAKKGGYWLYPNALNEILAECPYGKPGDRLWVRENWAICEPYPSGDPKPRGMNQLPLATMLIDNTCLHEYWLRRVRYFADSNARRPSALLVPGEYDERWRPSIFMPRWASRITLEITGVRVERLLEITESDAMAEGASPWKFGPEQCLTNGERGAASPYRSGFACLWDDINADRATWKSNPWVWVVNFNRVAD